MGAVVTDHALKIKAWLADENPEALLMDGFDAALVGAGRRIDTDIVAIYDRGLCIKVLTSQGLSDEEAEEHFSFNCEGAFVGPCTPFIGYFDFGMIDIEEARSFLAGEE